MGATVSASYFYNRRNPTTPNIDEDPTFDPHLGFQGERKQRVMVATQAELVSAKVPLALRDYCAHHYINYESCKKDKFPFFYRCHHEKHAYETCQMEDYVLRMKEFEREHRLLERKQRMDRKAAIRRRKEERANMEELEDC